MNTKQNVNEPLPASDLFGRVLLPDEEVCTGDKILLVGGSWITANQIEPEVVFHAKDFIEVRRPNAVALPTASENDPNT